MDFGFSYVGLFFLAMLMVPNIIWTKNQPKDYERFLQRYFGYSGSGRNTSGSGFSAVSNLRKEHRAWNCRFDSWNRTYRDPFNAQKGD